MIDLVSGCARNLGRRLGGHNAQPEPISYGETMDSIPEHPRPGASLMTWLARQDLLRGPFLFTDYWAGVLRFSGAVPREHEELGLVDRSLFRLGLDRPDLEVPRLRYYLVLFIIGPFLIPFRAFRRMGKYRIRFRKRAGEEIRDRLRAYHLDLTPDGPGRVRVSKAGVRLAEGLLDPYLVPGFASHFYAAYKLPLAAMAAIVLVGVLAPVLAAAGWLDEVGSHLTLIGFPLLTLLLYALFRDWITCIVGALPVLVGAYLYQVAGPAAQGDWSRFFIALAALLVLYLVIDWFLMPRPVPPVLMLYTRGGPGHPYAREGDAPYWLKGEAYWVWRYLMLTPGEINKFWEKDWERVDLWIRADGDAAGLLEWVVTDAHYRELWVPYARLGSAEALGRCDKEALEAVRTERPGMWLLEVDADVAFHAPFFRVISFLPDEGHVPARRVGHVLRALWKHAKDDERDAALEALERAEVREGVDLLEDVPEFIAHLAAQKMLSQPWRYWRYPLGANRRHERRVYETGDPPGAPPASDPALQIKAEGFS